MEILRIRFYFFLEPVMHRFFYASKYDSNLSVDSNLSTFYAGYIQCRNPTLWQRMETGKRCFLVCPGSLITLLLAAQEEICVQCTMLCLTYKHQPKETSKYSSKAQEGGLG